LHCDRPAILKLTEKRTWPGAIRPGQQLPDDYDRNLSPALVRCERSTRRFSAE
jgi:hypothetical protein